VSDNADVFLIAFCVYVDETYGQLGQDSLDRTAGTGQDSKKITGRGAELESRQLGQDSRNRTVETGQLVQDKWR
jgi:hypothetical protein